MTATQKNIAPAQAEAWLASGEAVLIDVREPEEFKAEHIAYALSMPLADVCASVAQLRMPASRKIVFQCLRGKRGEQACALVNTKALSCEVYNIEGGIERWKREGFPVVQSAAAMPKISVFRQVQMIVGSLVALCVLAGFAGQTWAFAVAGVLGAALAFAGLTGWCGLALLLGKAPWNKP